MQERLDVAFSCYCGFPDRIEKSLTARLPDTIYGRAALSFAALLARIDYYTPRNWTEDDVGWLIAIILSVATQSIDR